MELDPRTTAVVAIHCQGDVVGPTGALAGMFHQQVRHRNVLSRIADLLDAGRRAGCTTIFTRIAFAPDYSDLVPNSPILADIPVLGCMQDGSNAAEIVDEVGLQSADIVITHKRVGGFSERMSLELTSRGITTVLFCGVATNVSVESTARVATDLGYRVVIVEDACSAATLDVHNAAVASLGALASITSVDDVRAALNESVAPPSVQHTP
ncbi:hydrolase [Rhodococcoides trifolii]|uniref:Hydrolase n=1 Tax=Rhodococcoides trifolii TaxID=908250 RepID=A0A917LIM1_9NOCA|nr:cysteine hydrolase [Rhodococcus trifolii]GGG27288.1 hydrolase [Rhodococcus trifolii]